MYDNYEKDEIEMFKDAVKAAGSFYSSVYFPKRKEDSGSRSTPINLGNWKEINYGYSSEYHHF